MFYMTTLGHLCKQTDRVQKVLREIRIFLSRGGCILSKSFLKTRNCSSRVLVALPLLTFRGRLRVLYIRTCRGRLVSQPV